MTARAVSRDMLVLGAFSVTATVRKTAFVPLRHCVRVGISEMLPWKTWMLLFEERGG